MKGLLICSLGLFSAGLSYASFMGIEEGRGLIAPSKARDSVDLVLPLPPQTVLRPATGRSLESLETTLSSRWWTVDMAREGSDAMVLTLMHMPSGLEIEERDLPVRNSTPTKTLTLALPVHQGFLSSTRELECLDPTTLMEVMRS